MNQSEPVIFKNVLKIANNVKDQFRKKGIVIPSKQDNGDIVVGNYVISKIDETYSISNKSGSITYGPFNLAKTAAVIANELALGKHIDRSLIEHDAKYGFKAFEEVVANNKASQSKLAELDIFLYNAEMAHEMKLYHKSIIDTKFDKLSSIK